MLPPHASPHLPTSPHISPHLPTSPHISQVRAAMRASVKLKDSKAVALGEDGMYELTAAYDKVRKRL